MLIQIGGDWINPSCIKGARISRIEPPIKFPDRECNFEVVISCDFGTNRSLYESQTDAEQARDKIAAQVNAALYHEGKKL